MMKKISNINGFTLVELLVVIAIIGVIMAYALPAYNRQVIRSKRTEAQAVLIELASVQERHKSVFQQYATAILGLNETPASLGKAGNSKYNRTTNYVYRIRTVAGGYEFRAIARGASSQRDDRAPLFQTNCRIIRINAIGRKWPTACWQ